MQQEQIDRVSTSHSTIATNEKQLENTRLDACVFVNSSWKINRRAPEYKPPTTLIDACF